MLKKNFIGKSPINLLFIFEVLGLLLLFVYQGKNLDKLTLMTGVGLVLIIYISNYILSRFSSGDNYIFLIVTMLLSIGIIIIYRIDEGLGIKQLIWISAGILVYFATYFILKYIRGWKNWIYLYISGGYALFLLTFALASRKGGALNWVEIGGFSFQPSEITKILIIFLVSAYYSNWSKFKEVKNSSYYLMGIIYSYIILLFLQRDLGTALIFYAVFIVLQFINEENRKLLLINIGLFGLGGFLGYALFDHVKIRFQSWLNPWEYIQNQGYQITQSLFAIAEGGFFGKGLGLGHPHFIPVVYTDFIFSAICEEMGIFTGIGIIMLFMILVYRGFKIAISQDNLFYKNLALGISTLFGIQAFIILGGVLKMIPLTGLTLPFISYGGSSMLSSFCALGILQVCSEEIEIKEGSNEQGD
jgi:cell division protein FtsW (lipid II flippase)